MRLLCLISLFLVGIDLSFSEDLEKYRSLREQCERTPTNSECLKLKTKFLELANKCQQISSPQQLLICQQVKTKLCFVFPSTCDQTTTKSTTRRKVTKSKVVPTTTTTTMKAKLITTTVKAKPVVTTVTSSNVNNSLSNEEFIKVPIDPEELRIRGEYCIRHGKEKKCQQLLTNLKTTYSTCGKKKVEPKPEQIDCHSFQTHLCKAFPKFPPCLKKTP